MRVIHTLKIKRENSSEKWGFGITGGKDVALTFRVEKVSLTSPAGKGGLKNLDYLIKIDGKEVFDMGHNELVGLIRHKGTEMELEIERGEDVVPSFDLCFPRTKDEPDSASEAAKYFADAMKSGLAGFDSPGIFTSVGKPRVKTGKYNSSVGLYCDDTIMELATGSGSKGFVDPDKLAPDACPAAKNRKRFDPSRSSALSVIAAHEKGDYFPRTKTTSCGKEIPVEQ